MCACSVTNAIKCIKCKLSPVVIFYNSANFKKNIIHINLGTEQLSNVTRLFDMCEHVCTSTN